MTDKQTTDRFKYGDRQAFEDIYKECRQGLINFLQKYNVENAEDVAEDTFIRLWDNRYHIKPDMNLFNYICTVAFNIMKDNRKHNAVEQKYLSNALEQANIEQKSYSPEEELIARDLLQHIKRFITKLSKRQQQIFNLRWIQGFSYKEIAQKLGIKESTVK